jgi:Zn-dependent peptidase ImmA (M78 family)
VANRFSRIADQLRDRLGVSLDRFLDVADLLLRIRIDGLIQDFRLVPANALPDVDARWDAVEKTITIRQEVYDRAVAGNPHDRFTIAHEIGHAILGHPVRNRKVGGQIQFGQYLAAHELEADDFAIALLAPSVLVDLTNTATPEQLADDFGLPGETASQWFAALQNEPGRQLARPKSAIKRRRTVTVDTGDYEDAMWAMARNFERNGR